MKIRADLHIHTCYSYDAVSSPKEVVETAISRGINCVCVTDHGEVRGATEVLRAGYDKNILVIPGIEVKSKAGDILGINIKKVIPNGLSFKETLEEIRKQGGMAVIPHPFSWPVMGFKGREEDLLLADAVEVFNASLLQFSNKKALAVVQKYNLPFTAGSDAHSTEFIGRGFVEIQGNNFPASPEGVIEEIKNRRVKAGGEVFSLLGWVRDRSKKLTQKIFKNGFDPKKRKI